MKGRKGFQREGLVFGAPVILEFAVKVKVKERERERERIS